MKERVFTEEEIQDLIYFAQPEDGRRLWEALKQLKRERDEARKKAEFLRDTVTGVKNPYLRFEWFSWEHPRAEQRGEEG